MAKSIKFDVVAREIRRLYREGGQRLHPPAVVEAAQDPESVLHRFFTWDDSTAAQEYRLIQARRLIAQVTITIPSSKGGTVSIRAYHALRSEKNGYRHTTSIMAGPELRESLLSQLANDLERISERYECVKSLARAKSLFAVIEEFVGKHREKELAGTEA